MTTVHFTDIYGYEGYASSDDGTFEAVYNGDNDDIDDVLVTASNREVRENIDVNYDGDTGDPPEFVVEDWEQREATADEKVQYVRQYLRFAGGRVLDVIDDE